MPHDAECEINQSVKNEQPREKEMPAPTVRQILIARQRQPVRKCSGVAVSGAGETEKARSVGGEQENKVWSPASAVQR
jgi:hypothetical protein